MADVFKSEDHHFNKIVQADLREILPEWLHPEVTEVVISATDPMVDDPTTELWYVPASGLPPVPPALWDAAVTYAAGDYALWPDPDHWQAAFTNTGREPGTPAPMVTEGYQFPGTASGAVEGLTASAAGLSVGSGFELRAKTNGAVGEGVIFSGIDGSQISMIGLKVTPTEVEARVRGVNGLNGFHQWQVDPGLFDFAAKPWIAYTADAGANVITFRNSADGVTWTDVTTVDTSGDAMALSAQLSSLKIGNDGLSNFGNYTGVLAAVEVRDLGGALMSSWNSMTLAGADGTGASPETGETYTQVGPTALVPGAQVPGPDAWVAVPAPTAGSGTLYANVNGVWEEVTSEVVSEVEVDAVEPTGEWELWADTSAQSALPPAPSTPTPIALDDLTDVDTTTNAPTDGTALLFDAALGQWVPGVNLNSLSQYLPLTGGTMGSDAQIAFQNEEGDKIKLYGAPGTPGYGLGVAASALALFAGSGARLSFRSGTYNGTEIFGVASNGELAPRGAVNVAWESGWGGSGQFLYNPAVVSFACATNANPALAVDAWSKICALPAGVPAPWMTVTAEAAFRYGSLDRGRCTVQVRSDGVWCLALGAAIGVNNGLEVVLTWAR